MIIFCRINQPPLVAYLIHHTYQTQTVCKRHDFTFGFACEQAVHYFLRFELLAIAVIREVNHFRCFISALNYHLLGPPKLFGQVNMAMSAINRGAHRGLGAQR